MTRCAKFHHLFDEVGDFCGMSPTAISQYKAYREQVNKLVKLGIDEDFVFENFPEGPGRVLSNIKDDETRTKALNYVASCLKRKERVTEGDLRSTLKSWQESTGKSCTVGKRGANLGERGKHFTNVKPATSDTDVKTRNFDDEKPPASGEVLADRLKDAPHGSSSFHTASEELAAKKNGIAGEMFPGNNLERPDSSPAWTPTTCKTGPCPDGKTHAAPDKVRGVCCDLTGQPVNQISACPYLERQRRAALQEGPRPITDEHRPLNIIPTPLTKAEAEKAITSIIRGYFTPKSREQWEQVKKAGGWDTDLEALEGLRDDAAERIA